jgi:hypothetical protein
MYKNKRNGSQGYMHLAAFPPPTADVDSRNTIPILQNPLDNYSFLSKYILMQRQQKQAFDTASRGKPPRIIPPPPANSSNTYKTSPRTGGYSLYHEETVVSYSQC